MDPVIKQCDPEEFELVKKLIHEFELDDRQLKQEEFLTLLKDKQLIGFGRVREYDGYSEMCSTGVIPEARNKGYGSKLLKALEEKATQPVYVVSVIPSFFEKLGFEICNNYPPAIKEKLNYCIHGLPVEEKYVVMKKIAKNAH